VVKTAKPFIVGERAIPDRARQRQHAAHLPRRATGTRWPRSSRRALRPGAGLPCQALHGRGRHRAGPPYRHGTVTTSDHHSLVTAHLTKFRAGSVGSAARACIP
jgi:hypothetical protein